ncbi:hypothetical protein BAU67_001834 [Escherichia coli]|nr:hypothetical protein [Escherichia coli]EMB7054272.1 hypothetical protein [Escherichia coli]
MSKKNRRKRNTTVRSVNKSGNAGAPTHNVRMSEIGSGALSQIMSESQSMMVEELRWPQLIATVETMKCDSTVATALDTKYVFITKAFNSFKVLYNPKSEKSKDAADLVEYALHNLSNQQTLRDIARSAATFNEYGFSLFEKVYRREKEGKYAGMLMIDKIAFRPQASLSRTQPFVFDKENRELLGIYQSPTAFLNTQNIRWAGPLTALPKSGIGEPEVFIPAKKLMLMTLSGTESNPAGVSPMIGCYRSFREKVLIENLEVVGCSKDLGGVLELKIPSNILNKASIDPNSMEGKMVADLMVDAANAHSGEQSFFILPSDRDKSGKELYSMTLKGVDGMGKQYSTKDLIDARKKAILDRFGAGFINLGNDNVGSFSLSESKQSIHGHFVQRDIDIIVESFNKDLIPQILALNGIFLPDEDMPKIKPGLVEDVDMESFSKFVQRIGAVGYLPKTPSVINKILEVGGFDERIDDDMELEELLKILGEDTSRAGDGMQAGTSGNGTSKLSSVRDNSISNLEN